MKIYLLSFTVLASALLSCDNSKSSTPQLTEAATRATYLDSLTCDSVLHLLVISAGVPDELKDKLVAEDGGTYDTLLIKISHRNEAEPGAFVDAADGFLEIDMKHQKLFRVAREVDSLIAVQCDTHILGHYISRCAHYMHHKQ